MRSLHIFDYLTYNHPVYRRLVPRRIFALAKRKNYRMSINSSRRTGKDHLTKPATQSQLARLKREEEEELWISGEELYTEGSSDEEDSKTPSRSYRMNKNQDSRNSSASGKHHWVVSDDTKNSTERFNDRVDLNKSMNSNSEENSLSSLETTNSSIAESQNMQSNSSVQSDTTNVSLTTDDMCSDVAQDEEDEEEGEGQGLKDSEISWKVNRDRAMNLTWREHATELKELKQLDYQEGFDCIAQLRKKFRAEIAKKDEEFIPNHFGISNVSLQNDNEKNGTYLTHGVNEHKSGNTVALNDELKKQISKVQSLDAVIRKFDNNVENEMKETSLCQYKNRERLKEILSNTPLETGRLAENTRRFFNLCNGYADVPDKAHKIASSANQLVSVEQKADAITAVHEQCINERLLKNRKKATRLIRENKTLVTYHSTKSPIVTYEQQRIETLLRDDTVGSSNEIVNSSSNPYCVNDDEQKLLRELNMKLSVLQNDIARKSCKTYDKRENVETLNTCHTRITNNTAISTISTVSTISTLKNVDEEILTELLEDSKMVVASFADIDKRRQIIPFSKEI